MIIDSREVCFTCYRPKSSCMCSYIKRIKTKTKFVILMHPKEFRKTKNGTGHFTNLSLPNSEIHIGIDFTNHKRVNEIIENKNINSYVLYPGLDSIDLNTKPIGTNKKENVIFIIDSTWPCSKKMLRLSKNLETLPKVSFQYTKKSDFKIKTQPNQYCLSTIESTLCVLKLLNKHNLEDISNKEFDNFLQPFSKMVEYQINCSLNKEIRYK